MQIATETAQKAKNTAEKTAALAAATALKTAGTAAITTAKTACMTEAGNTADKRAACEQVEKTAKETLLMTFASSERSIMDKFIAGEAAIVKAKAEATTKAL